MSSADRWAIAEVMGHQRHVGRITEETIAGVPMLRVDQPRGDEYVTTYLAGSALFRLTPCTEEVARGDWSNRTSAPAALGSGSIIDAHLEEDDEWVCDTPGCGEPTEEDEPLCGLCLDNCLDIAGRCVDPDCMRDNPIPHAIGGTTRCVDYDPDDERSPRSQIMAKKVAAARITHDPDDTAGPGDTAGVLYIPAALLPGELCTDDESCADLTCEVHYPF